LNITVVLRKSLLVSTAPGVRPNGELFPICIDDKYLLGDSLSAEETKAIEEPDFLDVLVKNERYHAIQLELIRAAENFPTESSFFVDEDNLLFGLLLHAHFNRPLQIGYDDCFKTYNPSNHPTTSQSPVIGVQIFQDEQQPLVQGLYHDADAKIELAGRISLFSAEDLSEKRASAFPITNDLVTQLVREQHGMTLSQYRKMIFKRFAPSFTRKSLSRCKKSEANNFLERYESEIRAAKAGETIVSRLRTTGHESYNFARSLLLESRSFGA
jgi:hypothetical protein